MKSNVVYAGVLVAVIIFGFLFLPKPEVVQQRVDQEATEVATKRATPTIKTRSQPTPKNTAASPPPRQQAFTPPAGRISVTSVPTATVGLLVIPTSLQVVYQTVAAERRASTPPTAQKIQQQSAVGCGSLGPRGKCYCSQGCNPGGPPIFVSEGNCKPCTP